MMLSRILPTVGAAIVIAGGLLASTAMAQGKGESVKFQDYPGTGNMLARVAISKGYCEKYGIKCTLQRIPTGPLGAQALLAKSIDAGLFPAEVMTPAIANGAKTRSSREARSATWVWQSLETMLMRPMQASRFLLSCAI